MTTSNLRPLALVTGASAGIGKAFAETLAAQGYDVALVARRRDRLQALATTLEHVHGVSALVIVADLSAPNAHEAILAALGGRGVDVLINNAGYSLPKTFLAYPWAQQRDVVMTLVMAVIGLTHGVLPGMIARGRGRIITIGSMAGFSPGAAGHTLYPAAKNFVLKFSQSLDAEVRAKGIMVSCVAPGFVATEFQAANGMEAQMERGVPKALIQSPERLAATALRENAHGRVIITPDIVSTLASFLMRYLPDWIVIPMVRGGAEKFRVPE
jgi:short-subunit dehydrogenase